jgi:acyl carrier protein
MPLVTISDTVISAVVDAVAAAVRVDVDEVTCDATLVGDLGAEPIDLLDILFRLERALSVRISVGELARCLRGGVPDAEFADADEIVTARGLAELTRVMPQIDITKLAGKLSADDVICLFTVGNLAALVQQRLDASTAAA